jgi:DNA gyrase/topoisomerase IV subunit B
MIDNIQVISKKAIRERPYMYFGSDGIAGLFAGLLTEVIRICNTGQIVYEIVIIQDNEFSLSFSSSDNQSLILQHLSANENEFYVFLLTATSERFEIIPGDMKKIEIRFSFDKTVIPDPIIDYLKLSEKMAGVALLNRQTAIITIDKRKKYLNQNYYHFPQGIFYLFDKIKNEVLGKPEIEMIFDGEISSNKYQIGLAYRTDWHPVPNIISFANDVHTVYGGSMVEGILDGLGTACRNYVRINNLKAFKINRKKFLNGLIIVCFVRGDDFKYGGSFKETLEDNLVKNQVKKLTEKLASDFLSDHKEKADKFLLRFDTTQLSSKIYFD